MGSAIKRIVSKQGHALFSNMLIEVHNRFPASYFEEMKAKESAVALMPILNAALLELLKIDKTFATSVAVKMFLDKHDLECEGATNLCMNIFKNIGDLEKIKEEVELYHLVYTLYRSKSVCRRDSLPRENGMHVLQ